MSCPYFFAKKNNANQTFWFNLRSIWHTKKGDFRQKTAKNSPFLILFYFPKWSFPRFLGSKLGSKSNLIINRE